MSTACGVNIFLFAFSYLLQFIVNIIGYGCRFVIFFNNVVYMTVKRLEHRIRAL